MRRALQSPRELERFFVQVLLRLLRLVVFATAKILWSLATGRRDLFWRPILNARESCRRSLWTPGRIGNHDE